MEKTLVKGLVVLEALIERDQPCGVSDLAAQLKLSKSNTHRLLNTLLHAGYATMLDGRYSASFKVWELGACLMRNFDVRQFARPALEHVARETAEGARLTVLDPKTFEVVYIDKIESPQAVRTYTNVGERAPAHCTSSGKVLLAFQSEKVIRRASRNLRPHTRWTIVDREQFIRHLAQVRSDGYALNRKELSEQVRGVAAPIFDAEGRAVAAISIAAPAERLSSYFLRKVTAILCEAAADVSARMRPSSHKVVELSDARRRKRQGAATKSDGTAAASGDKRRGAAKGRRPARQ